MAFVIKKKIMLLSIRQLLPLVLLYALWGLVSDVYAQDTLRINGKIIDDDTQEPLPFAAIAVLGKTVGTYADIEGNYELTVITTGKDSLSVSMVGYNMVRKPILPNMTTLNFRLHASALDLEEVVILAGENPAHRIVKGIIRHKEENRMRDLGDYQVEEYAKVELDLHQIDTKMRESKLMKPFAFIFDNMDSVSDERPFLPAFIVETITRVYGNKGKPLKRQPLARQTSGVDNPTIGEFIETMHADVDVYNNWVLLLDKSFVSPFADNALGYYEYYILDSTTINGHWSYKLKYKPKRRQEPTFYGEFWVADTCFALQKVNMRLSPDANINLVNRILLYKEFDFIENRWLPTRSKMVFDFAANDKTPGLIGRKATSYKDYVFDMPQADMIYRKIAPDQVDPTSLQKPPDYWLTARHDSLSKNEAAIYAMIDSIQNVPIFKTYSEVAYLLTAGYKELGFIEIGNLYNLYNYNLVQGHRFKLSVGTSNKVKRFRALGFASIGMRDKKPRFGGIVQYNISKYPKRRIIGGSYRQEVDFISANSEEGIQNGFLSGIIRRPVPQKLLDMVESKIFYEQYWGKGWSNKITFLNYWANPYENIDGEGGGLNFQYISPQDDTLATINTSEIILKTRYAYKEKFLDGQFERLSLGTRYPRITVQLTAGIKGILESQYNYSRVMLNIQHWFYINPLGWLEYDLKLGKTFGTLPYLLLEVHPGNEGFFHDPFTFNTMNRFEFASDTYVALRLQHHFEGFFLNHIPLLRKLKWREVAEVRAIYGTMSRENQFANRLNFVDKARTIPLRAPSPRPFVEVGFGIENIFKVLRFDAIWRVNYHDNPEAPVFVPMASLAFYF